MCKADFSMSALKMASFPGLFSRLFLDVSNNTNCTFLKQSYSRIRTRDFVIKSLLPPITITQTSNQSYKYSIVVIYKSRYSHTQSTFIAR